MRKRCLVAMLGALLVAAPSLVGAQEAPATKAAGGQAMAAQHADMLRLHQSAIDNAEAVQQLVQATPLDKATIAQDATRARDALQAVVNHLSEAESHATAEQKEHIAGVRAHEEEALKHAQELVTAAAADQPDAAAIGAHANGVLEHARAATAVMEKAHKEPDK